MSDRLHRLARQIATRERRAILSGDYGLLPGLSAQKQSLLADIHREPAARQRALVRVLTAHQDLLSAARDGLRSVVRPAPPQPDFAAYGPDGVRAAMATSPGRMSQRT